MILILPTLALAGRPGEAERPGVRPSEPSAKRGRYVLNPSELLYEEHQTQKEA